MTTVNALAVLLEVFFYFFFFGDTHTHTHTNAHPNPQAGRHCFTHAVHARAG